MDKSLSVLFLIDRLDRGGTEKQCVALINELHAHKQPVSLCILNGAGLIGSLAKDIPVLDLQLQSLLSIHFFKSMIRLFQFIKANQITVVHTFFRESNVIGPLILKFMGVRVIITSRRDLGYWQTIVMRTVLSVANLLTDHIVVNSAAIKNATIEQECNCKNKIAVIPNFIIPADIYRLAGLPASVMFPECKKVVGIVANFNRKVKGWARFIQVSEKLLSRRNDVILCIIGIIPQEKEKLNPEFWEAHERSVVCLGPLDNPFPIIRQFAVALNVSYSEGFSNALLECMALSVPIVAFSNPGNQELVQSPFGVLIEENNIAAFVHSIETILDSTNALSIKMASDYLQERYSLQEALNKHTELYRKLLNA